MLYYNRISLSKNMPASVRFVHVAIKDKDVAEVGIFECALSKCGYPDPRRKQTIQDERIVALPAGTSAQMLTVLDTISKIRSKTVKMHYQQFEQAYQVLKTARRELEKQAREVFGLDDSWHYVCEGCTYVEDK